MIYDSFHGLTAEFDDFCGMRFGTKHLPNIKKVFVEVQREESWKKVERKSKESWKHVMRGALQEPTENLFESSDLVSKKNGSFAYGDQWGNRRNDQPWCNHTINALSMPEMPSRSYMKN